MPTYTPYYKGEPVSLPPLKMFLDFFYPVGSYYETTDTDFDPNTSWTGTWELEDEGLVHVSSGTNYVVSANDQDGGDKEHYHQIPLLSETSDGVSFRAIQPWNMAWGNRTYTKVTSPNYMNLGGTPQASSTSGYLMCTSDGSNMQPYKIVNRWHRTA